MNKIIGLIGVTFLFNLVGCQDKNSPNKTTAQPQTSNNPIAQPALDATDKAKQVEGIMKKGETSQKETIDKK